MAGKNKAQLKHRKTSYNERKVIMAKTYFSQYIDDLNKIIKDAREKHDMESIQRENARKDYEKVNFDRSASADKKVVAAAAFREAETAYRVNLESLQRETERELKTLRGSFEKCIAEYTTADPDHLDQSAVMLLNSGAMKDTDLLALANKYATNPTMLKMVSGCADKMLDKSKVARIMVMQINNYLSPTYRLRLFDDAVSIAMRTIDRNESRSGAFQKSWDENYYPAIRKDMAATEEFHLGE